MRTDKQTGRDIPPSDYNFRNIRLKKDKTNFIEFFDQNKFVETVVDFPF